MPKSFTDAKATVIAAIKKEEPENGMHAQWIRTKLGAAESMTEDDMKTELAKEKPASFSATRDVAEAISKKMTTGGRRKSRKSTRRRLTRRR